jgi:predicted metal-dependent hydrolase
VPLLDVPHLIRHRPEARGGAWIEDGALHVSGRAEHVPRRVREFLRAEARRRIHPLVFAHAGRLGRTPCRVSVKDTRSRWGSCSSRGDLAFSWRLVMAPEPVLSYVVAHEVAHLVEMNHAPAFWRLVATLIGDPAPARGWLRRHGAGLHRYG